MTTTKTTTSTTSKASTSAEDTPSPVYSCMLPLSTQTLTFLADLLRAHLKTIGSRWRKLPAGKIATIVLAVLRHDQRLADMAGANNVSASTVRRWMLETVELLAARAPRLDRALKKIAKAGGEVVLLDGTLIRTRRRTGADNRRNYSGKHKAHGLLVVALTDTRGNLLWVSAVRPGRASEITTARHNRLTARLREAGLGAIADLGFVGLDDDDDNPVIITGRKATRGRPLTPAQKQVNRLISAERAPVEHGFATLKAWRILTKLRLDAIHVTKLLRALMVLAITEHTR
ncbi:transposase family protein [Streptosporangium album]